MVSYLYEVIYMKEIILAGGCFWGVEAYFQRLNGVVKTIVGYIDGITENPSYEEVCSGTTNHAEACKILYDEKPLRNANISAEDLKHLKDLNLITFKPVLYVANVSDDFITEDNDYVNNLTY